MCEGTNPAARARQGTGARQPGNEAGAGRRGGAGTPW